MIRMMALPLVALLGGCSAQVPPPASPRTTYLVCDSTVRLDISHDGRFAVVRTGDGRELRLIRSDSELGTRYAAKGVSVLRSGDTYVYTDAKGSSVACVPLRR